MSAYAVFATNMKDGPTLGTVLTEMGFEVEYNGQPVTLYDYHGCPRPEKAAIIIRRKHTGLGASNDVGFAKDASGNYHAVISDYDRIKFTDSWLGLVKQGYKEQQTMAMARNRGYVFQSKQIVQTEKGPQVKLLFAAR
jgi:Protein of unknown function (DUF1257)